MSANESSPSLTTRVDVGGYRMAIICAGTGSPIVVLDAGMGDTGEVWQQVQEAVAQFTKVCSYDRAGQGQSDPGPGPHTSQVISNELHTLLARMNLPGPYVLVGHSFGGFNMLLYAHQYPQEVAGLVLVDSALPNLTCSIVAGRGCACAILSLELTDRLVTFRETVLPWSDRSYHRESRCPPQWIRKRGGRS